jgi:hypothetical protein
LGEHGGPAPHDAGGALGVANGGVALGGHVV